MDDARRRLLQAGGTALAASLAGCSTLSSLDPRSDPLDLTDEDRQGRPTPDRPGLRTDVGYGLGMVGFTYERPDVSTDPALSRAVVHVGTEITPSNTLHEFPFESEAVDGFAFYPYDWIENEASTEDTETAKDEFVDRVPTVRVTLVYENGGFQAAETVDAAALRANLTEIVGANAKFRRGRNPAVEPLDRGERFVVYRNLVGERLTVEAPNRTVERGRSEYEERVRLAPGDYYTDTTGDGVLDARGPVTVTVHQGETSKMLLEETPTLYEVSAEYDRNGSLPAHYLVSLDETERYTPFTVVSPEGEYLSRRLREWEYNVTEDGNLETGFDPRGTGPADEYTDEISGFGAPITAEQVTDDGEFIPRGKLPPEDVKFDQDDEFLATYAPIVEVHEDASHVEVRTDLRGERYVIETVRFD